MNIGKYVPTVATLIVAVVVLAGVAFPMIGGLSSETTTISNDGASWIRMAYITDQSDYSVEYTFGDNISVAGQSGEWEDMILYADSQCTICIVGDNIVLIVGDVAYVSNDPQTMTVSRSSGIVSIDGEPVSESTVSWAYVPVANGVYGSFGADTVPLHKDASNLAVVGGFAGVYAYNENVSMDIGLVMDADVTEEYINSVKWVLESSIPTEETQPFHPIDPGMFDPGILNPGTDDPAIIDDPSILDPEFIDPDIGGNQIMAVPTPTYTDGDWGFDLDGSSAIIVSYSGSGGNITIPSTVSTGGNTYTVYKFGKGSNNQVFNNANISDFTLTVNNAIRIDRSACYNCTHLTKLTINALDATYGIGIGAFQGCTGLQTVEVGSGITTLPTIGDSAFNGCTSLTTFPFEKLGYAGSGAFQGCTALTGEIILPNTVTRISKLFMDCTGITSVTVPSSVNSYGSEAFRGCTALVSATLNHNFNTTFSQRMFNGCTSLETVNITGSPTGMGYQMFGGCTSLESITIPSTVTQIEYSAFQNSGLKTLIIPSTVTTCGTGIAYGCTALESAEYNASTTSLPAQTFQGCTSLKEVSLSDSVTTIEDSALRQCTSLETIVIGSNISTINTSAFKDSNIENMIVLSNVIPNSTAFDGATVHQLLNLSENEWDVDSYGMTADEIRTDLEATSYMAPVSISETTTREGPTFDLLAILPIVFVAGLLLTTAWLFIRK